MWAFPPPRSLNRRRNRRENMSNKTDRGPPPPLRRPDQSAARGGPRPSWPCRVAPEQAAPDPDFGWPPGGQCGSHWGWPRCDAVLERRVGGRGGREGCWTGRRRGVRVMGSSMRPRADTRAGALSWGLPWRRELIRRVFFPFLVPVFLSSCFFLRSCDLADD